MTETSFCGGCGAALADGGHAECQRLLAYDPPRWCARCGHRLDVQVYPGGVTSDCRECRRRAGLPRPRPAVPGDRTTSGPSEAQRS